VSAIGLGATPSRGEAERWRNVFDTSGTIAQNPSMPETQTTKPCCQRTIDRMMRVIRESYVSFPVIKDVPCEECKEILAIRVYAKPE